MAERRQLTFASLDDVMPDVEHLLRGHITVGQWTLGQICGHLTSTFRWLSEGGPDSTLPPVPEAVRQRLLSVGRMRAGVQAPHPSLLPPPDLDDARRPTSSVQPSPASPRRPTRYPPTRSSGP